MAKYIRLLAILSILHLPLLARADSGPFGMPISESVIVTFPDSGTLLRPSAQQVERLTDAKNAALVAIRGRTSTQRFSGKDEKLALSRSLSARSYLIGLGVSPLKISINFASATDFLADNSTPEGKRSNQRVEIDMIYVLPHTN